MNKTLTITLILLLTGTFYACKKTWFGKTKAEITVTEKGSGALVANAKVRLVEYDAGSFMGLPATNLIETFTTDENGCVEFEFDHDRDKSYRVFIEHDNYYKKNHNTNKNHLKTGYKNEISFELQPEAWLKVYIRNVNPVDVYDKITVGNIGTPSGGGGTWTGTDVDTFTVARLWGNHQKNLQYKVTKSGEEKTYTKDIYCPAHETTEFTIEY